ncbi:Importin subunit beta-5 [Spathaspora sp. JA1]|nr:Importin subunit beta-5 [Spathaspora sp. JA1]
MADLLITLILNQTNPDNNIRTSAELEFNEFVKQDPTNAAYLILESSLNQEYPVDLRQSCLLHLKRLVPLYWSMGFQSFIGPPISQEVKVKIRQSLLELATSSPESKLRNGSAYAIVQIASSDYPDEWPELLNLLYTATMNFTNEIPLIGGLQVLTDLFDDLITEDQFWEGGIAGQVTNHINNILTHEDLSCEVKTQAIKLYSNVVAILSSPEAFNKSLRKQFVINHVSQSIQIFTQLLEKSSKSSIESSSISLAGLNLRTAIYRSITLLLGHFHKKISQQVKTQILGLTIQDFHYVGQLFENFVVTENTTTTEIITTSDSTSITHILSNLVEELLLTISNCQLDISIQEVTSSQYDQFIQDLVSVSSLTQSTIEEYQADINVYTSDLTGLSTVSRVRETVNDVLSELNDVDSSEIYKRVIQGLIAGNKDWRLIEAQLYILESLFINEDSSFETPSLTPNDLLNLFTRFISYEQPLVTSRSFILLPKFFEKFIDIPKSTKSKTFSDMVEFTVGLKEFEGCDFIKIACLVTITYYKHVIEFNQDLTRGQEIQSAIFTIVSSLIEDSEDDGLPSLLEAITEAISIDPQQATSVQIIGNVSVIDLIFKITFKDPANVQLIVDTSDCLTSLLKNITIDNYLQTCEKSLPIIFEIMKQEIDRNNVEYSPELYLALELLSIIIESVPEQQQQQKQELPSSIFYYAFPILRKVLSLSQDNQILQSGGEVFNNIIQKASTLFLEYQDPETNQSGIDCMMEIVYKFLSPDLSDSAANNCGSIVYSLINQFQSYLSSDLLTQILKATVLRLSYAKESITIENLIMVFCKLIINSPQEMVDFLSNNISLTIDGLSKSGLEIILPIWFESYEVTRGFEPIKQNSLALGKIFSLGDSRVENIVVNGEIIPYEGDLIITRSMAKSMPDKYTQIPAYLLIQFLRECTVKDLGHFRKYYEELNEQEKKIITENLVF